eukprot:gene4858-21187_t
MALGVPGMHRKNPNISLIFPKIEPDLASKDPKISSDIASPKSMKSNKQERMPLSFPSLTDEVNNNCIHDRATISTRYQSLHDTVFHGSSPKKTVNLQFGKKGKLKLRKDDNTEAFLLKREKHIDLSTSTNTKKNTLKRDSRVVNTKLTTKDTSRYASNQTQKRIQNCSILGKNGDELIQERLYREIQKQDAIDVDRNIEIGSIKKCCVWMEMWFDESGHPKLDTDDDLYETNDD